MSQLNSSMTLIENSKLEFLSPGPLDSKILLSNTGAHKSGEGRTSNRQPTPHSACESTRYNNQCTSFRAKIPGYVKQKKKIINSYKVRHVASRVSTKSKANVCT